MKKKKSRGDLKQVLREGILDGLGATGGIWPGEFLEDDPETAYRFVLNLRTWNEAERKDDFIPDRPYLKALVNEWHQAKCNGETLIIQKCRRMVVSWLFRGLELWEMGRAKCDLLLGGEDYEAAAKHVWRLSHLYNDLRRRCPYWDLPEGKTLSYKGERMLTTFSLANGSQTTAINSRSGSIQGEGTGGVTMEEFSRYASPTSMLAQAKIVTQGSSGAAGGFVVCITNAAVNYGWQQIKRSRVRGEDLLRGLERYDLESGERFLVLHHYADLAKQEGWLKQVEREMASTPDEFRLEILMQEDVHEGVPVWASFDRLVHRGSFEEAPEEALWWGGWDCGTSRQPAFTLHASWVLDGLVHVRTVLEVCSLGGESMELFAPKVNAVVSLYLGPVKATNVRHYADATVVTKSGAVEISAQDVARRHGFRLEPVSNAWAGRSAAMTWLLALDATGAGTYRFDSQRCPVLSEGFDGGYKWRTQGDLGGPGQVILEPAKNGFSHVHDSAQYAAVMMRELYDGLVRTSFSTAVEMAKLLAGR